MHMFIYSKKCLKWCDLENKKYATCAPGHVIFVLRDILCEGGRCYGPVPSMQLASLSLVFGW